MGSGVEVGRGVRVGHGVAVGGGVRVGHGVRVGRGVTAMTIVSVCGTAAASAEGDGSSGATASS